MILRSLVDYYERCQELPREGWIRRGIDYELVLSTQGDCVGINALGDSRKGKIVPAERLVTAIGKQALKHTNSGKDANLLWDNAGFVLGIGNKGQNKLASFIKTLQDWLGAIDDSGVQAIHRFCLQLQKDAALANRLIERFGYRADFEKRDPVLTFRLQGDIESVHERPMVRRAYAEVFAEMQGGGARGNCLITGAVSVPISLTETVIKGVWDKPGAIPLKNIVSFNERAFESYGKTKRQGENAPVSRAAAFAYTTALNHLLRQDSPQRMQVGDASTVFWADKQDPIEESFGVIFGDDPDESTRAVQALLQAVHSGKWGQSDEHLRFYVLGLAPNAARISVRFFHCVTLRELGQRIAQHFEDLALVRGQHDAQYPSLKRLLQTVCLATSKQPFGDMERLPPNLGGDIMDAIFAGENTPYPAMWLNAAVGRCRADQAKKTQQGTQAQNVPYVRAAVIKACLNRQIRRTNLSAPPHLIEKEFLPMLDLSNTHPAYRLGRLFAVLEKIQEEASPGLNATIRDRYYGAASSTPVAVFTTLLRLKNAHLKKLAAGRVAWFERLLGEVLAPVNDFPKHLPLPDQGRFALGYYHQRQELSPRQSKDAQNINEGDNA